MCQKGSSGEIIQLHHDIPVGGHGGRWKTTELVTRNYWWLGVMKKVGKYIDGYDTCQRYKNRSKAPVDKLMPNAILEKPWSHILADFITKLPLAQEYDIILIVYNCITNGHLLICDWCFRILKGSKM